MDIDHFASFNSDDVLFRIMKYNLKILLILFLWWQIVVFFSFDFVGCHWDRKYFQHFGNAQASQ